MTEYIEREAAIDSLTADNIVRNLDTVNDGSANRYHRAAQRVLESIPAANVRPVVRAKWEDIHIDRPEIADLEVASMFCPNCNRWHNRVYHYGNPVEFENFCSFCGAWMGES